MSNIKSSARFYWRAWLGCLCAVLAIAILASLVTATYWQVSIKPRLEPKLSFLEKLLHQGGKFALIGCDPHIHSVAENTRRLLLSSYEWHGQNDLGSYWAIWRGGWLELDRLPPGTTPGEDWLTNGLMRFRHVCTVGFFDAAVTRNDIESFFVACPNPHRLRFVGCRFEKGAFHSLIDRIPVETSLCLHRCEAADAFRCDRTDAKKLHQLELVRIALKDMEWAEVFQRVAVRELLLGACRGIREQGFAELSTMGSLRCLRILPDDEQEWEAWCRDTSVYSQITVLSYFAYQYPAPTKIMIKTAKCVPHVESLAITVKHIDDHALIYLQELRELQILQIQAEHIQGDLGPVIRCERLRSLIVRTRNPTRELRLTLDTLKGKGVDVQLLDWW